MWILITGEPYGAKISTPIPVKQIYSIIGSDYNKVNPLIPSFTVDNNQICLYGIRYKTVEYKDNQYYRLLVIGKI